MWSSYDHMYQRVLSIGSALLRLGVCRGEAVGLLCDNCPEWVLVEQVRRGRNGIRQEWGWTKWIHTEMNAGRNGVGSKRVPKSQCWLATGKMGLDHNGGLPHEERYGWDRWVSHPSLATLPSLALPRSPSTPPPPPQACHAYGLVSVPLWFTLGTAYARKLLLDSGVVAVLCGERWTAALLKMVANKELPALRILLQREGLR